MEAFDFLFWYVICFVWDCLLGSLSRPVSNFEDKTRDSIKADASAPVKLDAAAQAHIEKHRYLCIFILMLN
jgi:hypothetical protein